MTARKLAYGYARKLELKYPEEWDKNEIAGREWLVSFMHRSKDLSLRTPESKSLSRATSFNRTNCDAFYNNLKSILQRHNFSANNILNCDETAVTPVHKPLKIISSKGQKQVGQATSAERGQLVTMCNFISAAENTLPPAYVFPRVRFVEHMLHGAPKDSLGLTHQTGWMTAELFLDVIKYFITFSKARPDNPVLLLIDNHESHMSIKVIDEAKNNGVHILTFPPYCSLGCSPSMWLCMGHLKHVTIML